MHGLACPGLHCPECGGVTKEVGEIRSLTRQQMVLLAEVGTGDSNKEIAQRMGLTVGTVKVYVTHLILAAGVKNRTQLAILWHKTAQAIHQSRQKLGAVA